jgi:hypothetical protein
MIPSLDAKALVGKIWILLLRHEDPDFNIYNVPTLFIVLFPNNPFF